MLKLFVLLVILRRIGRVDQAIVVSVWTGTTRIVIKFVNHVSAHVKLAPMLHHVLRAHLQRTK